MKAIFITYNQILNDRVHEILDRKFARGFSKWELTHGRGSTDGEPHYGSHAWPSMNSSILSVVDESKVKPIMDALRELDTETKMQGLRAFVWSVEDQI